ncbi:MAG: PGPGW domain-containing protein [Alphaproteobacteria bacterium]
MAEAGATLMKTIVLQTVGYSFLVLGVIGLVVPILQGMLFLAIGMIILAKTAPWADRLLERFRQRFPKAAVIVDRAEHKVEEWGQKVAQFFSGKS